MRITSVDISGYRCLNKLSIRIDDYTALVGPNGTGKSTVLYALNWFFNGGQLDEHDLCNSTSEDATVSVQVTFSDLTAADRQVLGNYGVQQTAVLRRTWSSVDGEKMIGNATEGPGFTAVRNAGAAMAVRNAYKVLCEKVKTLPTATTAPAVQAALTAWEADPVNVDQLVDVDDADANHLFGFNGEATLSRLMRLVLVPASSDLANELGQVSRGSALGVLIGTLMADAVKKVRSDWEAEDAKALAGLEDSIRGGVAAATGGHADLVSAHLAQLVPTASISFEAVPPAWNLRGDTGISTSVKINEISNDVGRQGHGVQRAVMIAMLQALVMQSAPAAPPTVADDLASGISGGDEISGGQNAEPAGDGEGPALIVCIEEPEIYQHPVRARNFARVLAGLSDRERTQVVLATHSPYFVRPDQFDSLRRITLETGCALLTEVSVTDVAHRAGVAEHAVKKLALQELPRTLSEAFFAEAVVLVEGDTDRVVIEMLAERLGAPLDALGIVVLPIGGKSRLRIPCAMLGALGIPVYVVADADAGGAKRKHSGEDAEAMRKCDEMHRSHQSATEKLCGWLPTPTEAPLHGQFPFKHGDTTTVASAWTIWHDDLEAELEEWDAFTELLAQRSLQLRSKDTLQYRNVMYDVALVDVPDTLRCLVAAVTGMTAQAAPSVST